MLLSYRKLFSLFIAATLPAAVCISAVSANAESAAGKKIIDFGGPPALGGIGRNPLAIKNTGAKIIDALPVDGFVYSLSSAGDGSLVTSKYMTPGYAVSYDALKPDIEAMSGMDLKRAKDNFLRINVAADLTAGWFDDIAWERILANATVASRAAHEARAAGFLLDTEQYNINKPFSYMSQPDRLEKSFEDYRAQVRKRGREFMRALSSSCPGTKVLITFSNSYLVDKSSPLRIKGMGLWPAFLDGMMDADLKAEFIDGYEQSYTYRTYAEFRQARKLIKEDGAAVSQDPRRYKRRIKVAFGLWLGSPEGELNRDDFSKNHFSPEEFKHALHYALRLSDGYVWLYAARWLKLPDEYMEAVKRAREPQSLDFKPAQRPGRGPLDYKIVSTRNKPGRADGSVFEPYVRAGYDQSYDFPKQWRFRLDPADKGIREDWYGRYDARQWRDINISDWWEPQIGQTYLGYAWYRFELDAPGEWKGRKLLLVFGAVDEQAWVWVNCKAAGKHAYGTDGWNVPFEIDVTGSVVPGARNILCVRVHNSAGPGGIWKSVRVFSK